MGKDGIEYVDLESGDVSDCEWVRGMCRYGVMPANGLIYVPPHSCQCFAEAKLNGFMALAVSEDAGPENVAPNDREKTMPDAGGAAGLRKGPAFDRAASTTTSSAGDQASMDWPVFRASNLRDGRATCPVPEKLAQLWKTDLPGLPTAVTVARGRLFVGCSDTHTLFCLDAENGARLWSYTAGGPIDSPPACASGRLFFGSHDGWVYCLTQVDGQLVWRFRAAPQQRRIVVYGQLESPWPVHGAVLVQDGKVYALAGRSMHLDGGLLLHVLDARSGAVLQQLRMTPDLQSKGELSGAALPDILISDGPSVWMRRRRFDAANITAPVAPGEAPLSTTAGFLDRSWFYRTYWSYQGRLLANALAFDESEAYALHAYGYSGGRGLDDRSFRMGTGNTSLASYDVLPLRDALASRKKGPQPGWKARLPMFAQALLLSERQVLAAGAPSQVDPDDHWAWYEGLRGGMLVAYSRKEGEKLAQYPLASPPVPDGLAAANGRLYLSLKSKEVLCMGAKE
jgi:hypothetical protein